MGSPGKGQAWGRPTKTTGSGLLNNATGSGKGGGMFNAIGSAGGGNTYSGTTPPTAGTWAGLGGNAMAAAPAAPAATAPVVGPPTLPGQATAEQRAFWGMGSPVTTGKKLTPAQIKAMNTGTYAGPDLGPGLPALMAPPEIPRNNLARMLTRPFHPGDAATTQGFRAGRNSR